MKILVALILFTQFMDFKQFEVFIGKDISYANKILSDEGFKHKDLLGVNLFKSEEQKWLYGVPYNMVSIMINDDNTIKDVIVHFNYIIDDEFYNSFIISYGEPDIIQIVEGYESTNETEKGIIFKMREGTFDENPLFMIWNQENYQIRILLKYEENISEIAYRKPTDKL